VLAHGSLQPGSLVSTPVTSSEVSSANLSFAAASAAEFRVDRHEGVSVGWVDVGLTNLRASASEVELGYARTVSIHVEGRDLDLAHSFMRTASFAVTVSGARSDSLAVLGPILPAAVAIHSEAAQADGYFEGRLTDESAEGQIGFNVHALSLASGKSRLTTDVEGSLKLERVSIREQGIDLTGSRVSLGNASANLAGVDLRAPAVGLVAKRARLWLEARPDVDLDIEVPRLDVTHLQAVNELLPGRGSAAVVGVAGGSASASLHLDVDLASLAFLGGAQAVTHDLRMNVGKDTYEGELGVTLRAQRVAEHPEWTAFSGSTVTFAGTEGPLRAVLEGMAEGVLAVVNPFGAVAVQNKRSMALLWEQIHKLPPSAQAAVESHIPLTRRLEVMHKEQLLAQRAEWVMKSDYGAEGEEVIVGRDVDDATWRRALDHARPRRWVAQRYFVAERDERGATVNYGVFLIAGKAAGLYARAQAGATDARAESVAALVA
jgi:hypothetical protein